MNIPELIAQITAKADAEPAFRQALVTDPRGTIAELTGLSLPADFQITVFQETAQQRCLVLPPETSDELSDADLATVAGGKEDPPHVENSKEMNDHIEKLRQKGAYF